MIEIISIKYITDILIDGPGSEPYWLASVVVDGFEIKKRLYAPVANTEGEVEAWLNSHYEELLEKAYLTYGSGITLLDVYKKIMPSAVSRQEYALSVIAGLTYQQIDQYIDNNLTNLAEAREFLKKLSKVVLLLARETRLE